MKVGRPTLRPPELALAREERKEGTRAKLIDLGDRVLSDETLDPQRANAAAHAWAKAEAMMQPKTRVEITRANGRLIETNELSNLELARRIALIFREAAREEKAGLIGPSTPFDKGSGSGAGDGGT